MNNYSDKIIHYYKKPRLFVNEDALNRTNEIRNDLPGWSFINNDDQ